MATHESRIVALIGFNLGNKTSIPSGKITVLAVHERLAREIHPMSPRTKRYMLAMLTPGAEGTNRHVLRISSPFENIVTRFSAREQVCQVILEWLELEELQTGIGCGE